MTREAKLRVGASYNIASTRILKGTGVDAWEAVTHTFGVGGGWTSFIPFRQIVCPNRAHGVIELS
jgi:hypothetical protein